MLVSGTFFHDVPSYWRNTLSPTANAFVALDPVIRPSRCVVGLATGVHALPSKWRITPPAPTAKAFVADMPQTP